MIQNYEQLGTVIDLLKALLVGENVSKLKNKELYDQFLYNSDIEECLKFILNRMDIELYKYKDQLFISPGVENKLFGYTNEELKRKIPYVNKIEDLHLCYFVIMAIVTEFYQESGMDTFASYLQEQNIIKAVSEKLDALVKKEDLETVSQEYEFNFAALARNWVTKPDDKKDNEGNISEYGIRDKYALVHSVCNFLADEKLLYYDGHRKVYMPTDRLKAIVYYYYEDKDNKNSILDFVNDLGGKNAAY